MKEKLFKLLPFLKRQSREPRVYGINIMDGDSGKSWLILEAAYSLEEAVTQFKNRNASVKNDQIKSFVYSTVDALFKEYIADEVSPVLPTPAEKDHNAYLQDLISKKDVATLDAAKADGKVTQAEYDFIMAKIK